jgi:hypothetical protein
MRPAGFHRITCLGEIDKPVAVSCGSSIVYPPPRRCPFPVCDIPWFDEALSSGTCENRSSLTDGEVCTQTCTPGVSYSNGTSGTLAYACASGEIVPPIGECVACPPPCSSVGQYQQSPCAGMVKLFAKLRSQPRFYVLVALHSRIQRCLLAMRSAQPHAHWYCMSNKVRNSHVDQSPKLLPRRRVVSVLLALYSLCVSRDDCWSEKQHFVCNSTFVLG